MFKNMLTQTQMQMVITPDRLTNRLTHTHVYMQTQKDSTHLQTQLKCYNIAIFLGIKNVSVGQGPK